MQQKNNEVIRIYKTCKVQDPLWWDEDKSYTLPLLTKEELEMFSARYLLSQKPRGLKELKEKYFAFSTLCFKNLPQYCAVNTEEFIEVLESKPHVPNKKEGKAIRKEKAKRKK